jgi:hypothetical protein
MNVRLADVDELSVANPLSAPFALPAAVPQGQKLQCKLQTFVISM